MRPALTDRQLSRMAWRIARFTRLLRDEARAEVIADRLADRDHDRDDRRACLECHSIQQGRDGLSCAYASRGVDPATGQQFDPVPLFLRYFRPLPDVLQRCPHFSFATPA